MAPRNILVLGNGADLALGFATSYVHFLLYLFTLNWVYLYQSFALNCKAQTQKHKFNLNDRLAAFLDHCSGQEVLRSAIAYFSKKQAESEEQDGRDLHTLKILSAALCCLEHLCPRQADAASQLESYLKLKDNVFLRDFLEVQIVHSEHFYKYRCCFDQCFNEYLFCVFKHDDLRASQISALNMMAELAVMDLTENALVMAFVSEYEGFEALLNSERQTLHGWLDVELFIEYLVTQREALQHKFGSSRHKEIRISEELAHSYQRGIEDFNRLFADYLSAQPKDSPQSSWASLPEAYLPSARLRSKGVITDFSLTDSIDAVLDFNYTPSSNQIFKGLTPQVYHLHGSVAQHNLIFGYTRSEHTEVESFCYLFEKKVLRIIKNTDYPDLTALSAQPFNLLVFGHSLSPADGYVLERLFTSPGLKTALVLCHTQNALADVYTNLLAMLGDEALDSLLSEREGRRRLYFAVREEGQGQA